jgi:hypothetical protein
MGITGIVAKVRIIHIPLCIYSVLLEEFGAPT